MDIRCWLCWTLKMHFILLWTVNESCPAGAQGPVQETAQVLREPNTTRPHGRLCCVLYGKVTVVYLLCHGSALDEKGVVCAIPATLWDERALELMLLLRSGNGLLLCAMDCLADKGTALLSCQGAVAVLDEHAGLPSLLKQYLPV